MRALRRLAAVLGLIVTLMPFAAMAVLPDEVLPDAKLEARARAISAGLRCLVCQNESIDDSGAELARDLRLLVRERLKVGDSDDQVRAFLVQRYGDFILLKPPLDPETALLWALPLIVLAGGAVALVRRRSRGAATSPAPLDQAERDRLARILGSDEAG